MVLDCSVWWVKLYAYCLHVVYAMGRGMSVVLVHVFGRFCDGVAGGLMAGRLLEAELFAKLANGTHLACFDLFRRDA